MRRSFVALSVAAASLALAAGLTAPAAQAVTVIPTGRYAIGDSVMLGAKPNLASRGFVVNATESRQFSAALSDETRQSFADLWEEVKAFYAS